MIDDSDLKIIEDKYVPEDQIFIIDEVKQIESSYLTNSAGAYLKIPDHVDDTYAYIMNQLADTAKNLKPMIVTQTPKSDHVHDQSIYSTSTNNKFTFGTAATSNFDWASTAPINYNTAPNTYTCPKCAAKIDTVKTQQHIDYHKEHDELKKDFEQLLDMLSSYFDSEDQQNEGHDDFNAAAFGKGNI